MKTERKKRRKQVETMTTISLTFFPFQHFFFCLIVFIVVFFFLFFFFFISSCVIF